MKQDKNIFRPNALWFQYTDCDMSASFRGLRRQKRISPSSVRIPPNVYLNVSMSSASNLVKEEERDREEDKVEWNRQQDFSQHAAYMEKKTGDC